jgi:hypothetical protein
MTMVIAVRSLAIRPVVMVRGMGVRSWFGFQVRFRFAGASGFQELGQRRRPAWLPAAEPVDDDHVLGTAWWPAVGEVGEREVIGVLHLTHVGVPRPLGRDLGTVGLAASAFVRCPVVVGHWLASLPAATLGWRGGPAGSASPW